MKPVNNYVLIKKDGALEKTPGGIIVPNMGATKSTSGVVEDVGCTVSQVSGIKKGVRVRYSERVGVEMDDNFLVLKDTDILCVE